MYKTLEENKKTGVGKIYSIKDNDFHLYEKAEDRDPEYSGMKLLEYDNSNENYAEIYYVLYDYSTEPSFKYTLEIKDKSNNTLLMDNQKEEQIMPGIVSNIRIQKVNLDSILNISIFEKDAETEEIFTSAETQVDLKNNLESEKKINQNKNLKDGVLGDIKFKYIDSEYTYFGTTSHSYSKDLVGETCSLPIKIQYGNYLPAEEHIEFSYEKNVNNLTLEEAFEATSLINSTMGQYGLSDVYGLNIIDKKGEVIDTVIVNFEDMIKLCKDLPIEVNGKKYTKDSFDTYAELEMVKEKKVKIANKIDAIQYSFESGEYYMFIYNDNIYNLKLPMEKRINDEVKQFFNTLKEQ